jgi:hypothetical protein
MSKVGLMDKAAIESTFYAENLLSKTYNILFQLFQEPRYNFGVGI